MLQDRFGGFQPNLAGRIGRLFPYVLDVFPELAPCKKDVSTRKLLVTGKLSLPAIENAHGASAWASLLPLGCLQLSVANRLFPKSEERRSCVAFLISGRCASCWCLVSRPGPTNPCACARRSRPATTTASAAASSWKVFCRCRRRKGKPRRDH